MKTHSDFPSYIQQGMYIKLLCQIACFGRSQSPLLRKNQLSFPNNNWHHSACNIYVTVTSLKFHQCYKHILLKMSLQENQTWSWEKSTNIPSILLCHFRKSISFRSITFYFSSIAKYDIITTHFPDVKMCQI